MISLIYQPSIVLLSEHHTFVNIEQKEQPAILIHNKQSYPHVGGYWTVHFSVVGTADLTITAVNTTNWSTDSLIQQDVDLIFNQITEKPGKEFDIIWQNNSVCIKDFSSNFSLYETSKVLTTGKHVLKFTFGNDTAYAFNDATNWWNTNWNCRKKITINYTQVAGNLANFPVLINTTDADLQKKAETDGSDIAFVSYDNTTQFSHEIEEYDDASGSLVAWVNVTSISSTADTSLWMYYDASYCINQEDAPGVWDGNFQMVHHLEESDIDGGDGDIKDSTINGNDGTTQNMDSSDDVNAVANGGFDFDGTNDYISTDYYNRVGTLSFWFNTRDFDVHHSLFGQRYDSVEESGNWQMHWDEQGDHKLRIYAYDPNGGEMLTNKNFSLDQWYHVVVTSDGSEVNYYVNGQHDSTHTFNVELGGGSNDDFLYIGGSGENDAIESFNGMLDEVRVSSNNRGESWISTSYNNMNNQSTFIMLGSEDQYTSGGNNNAWHDDTWLNVTVEHKCPRILWYDFQKCTNETFDGYTNIDGQPWSSRRNSMTETDNDTWYRFIVNVSSDQGWDNIEYINISGWHDNGSDGDADGGLTGSGGYNRSGNHGGNRNFFLKYENVSGTPYFNLTYPANNTEITIGGFSELNVTDMLGIVGQTETRNISFVFKPGYQFRYAPGPGDLASWMNDSVNCTSGFPSGSGYDPTTCCWESLDNPWSWNFNITVENSGERWEDDSYKSWVLDEFGIYTYTEIVSVGNAEIRGAPGDRYSTNGSSWYNRNFDGGNSGNVTVCTRSNGNYSLTVNVSDLLHSAVLSGDISDDPLLHLDNTTIWVRGGNRTTSLNFSDSGRSVVWLYGFGNPNGTVDDNTKWQSHEPNGTCKYTGENASDTGLSEQYPDEYDKTNFNGLNPVSYSVEFACDIPSGQLTGKYSTHVYYHLRTQRHP